MSVGLTMLKSYSAIRKSFLRALINCGIAAALVVTVAISASAYSLIFRDGRRVEIPDDFTLTRKTITYELAPGFNQTVLVALLDISATERANHESAGTFFNHIQRDQPQPSAASPQTSDASPTEPARLTVTNDN